jgi:hypothetical protein
MLYCLAVKGDSVNRPREVVEWSGLGRTQWASEEGRPLFAQWVTFRIRNPLPKLVRSTHAGPSQLRNELCQTSRGSAVYRPDSPSPGQGLRAMSQAIIGPLQE